MPLVNEISTEQGKKLREQQDERRKFGTENLQANTDLPEKTSQYYKENTGTATATISGAEDVRNYEPGPFDKLLDPDAYAAAMQERDIQRGMYALNLPSDYAQQQRQLATQMGTRQAPELDLTNYNQDRAAMMQALDYQNANRDQFISAGYEGQKALGTAAQYAAKNAARGTNLSQMADQNRSAQEIASRVGAQAANEENATRNRLIQGAAQARAQDQQVVKAWQNAQLTQRSMNDAMVKFYLTQGMDYEQAQAQAQLEAAKLYASRKGLGQQAQGNALQTVATVIGTIIAL